MATNDRTNDRPILTTGGGEPLADAFDKINENFDDLFGIASNFSAVNRNIIPDASETYDIGNAVSRFRDIYLSGNTIHLGNKNISVNEQGELEFGGTKIPTQTDLDSTIAATSSGPLTGTLTGDVYATDSTLLVDAQNGKIVGPVEANVTGNVDASLVEATTITAQGGSSNDTGGSVNLVGANGASQGGGVTVAGAIGVSGDGGNVNIAGGIGSSGDGGNVSFVAGTGTIAGGDAIIAGGAGDTNGGNVFINAGPSAGTDGKIFVNGDVTFVNNKTIDFTNANVTGLEFTLDGELKGSVFADDSTLLVDGVNSKIVGNVDTSVVETNLIISQGGNLNATGASLIVGAANGTAQGGNTLIGGGVGTAGNGGTANLFGGPGNDGNGGDVFVNSGVGTNGNGGHVYISSGQGDVDGGTVYITSANGGSGDSGGIELQTQNGYISLKGPTISIGTSEDDSGIYIGQHNINNTTTTNIYGDVIHRENGVEFRGSDITFTEYQPDNKFPTVDFTNADVTGAGFTFNQPVPGNSTEFGFDADIIDFGDGKTIDMQNSTVLLSGSTISNVTSNLIENTTGGTNITMPYDDAVGSLKFKISNLVNDTYVASPGSGADTLVVTDATGITTDWKVVDNGTAYSITDVSGNTLTVPGVTFNVSFTYLIFDPTTADPTDFREVTIDRSGNLEGLYSIDGLDFIISPGADQSFAIFTSTGFGSTNIVSYVYSSTLGSIATYRQKHDFSGSTTRMIAPNAVPSTSKGQSGDMQGYVAFGGSYIYYCTADYTDGVADIWKRVAWSSDTW